MKSQSSSELGSFADPEKKTLKNLLESVKDKVLFKTTTSEWPLSERRILTQVMVPTLNTNPIGKLGPSLRWQNSSLDLSWKRILSQAGVVDELQELFEELVQCKAYCSVKLSHPVKSENCCNRFHFLLVISRFSQF